MSPTPRVLTARAFFANAYLAELAGESMFRLLVCLTRAEEVRRCWQVLLGLECQTQQMLLDHVPVVRGRRIQRLGAKVVGSMYGLILGILPSRVAMRWLASSAAPYLTDYTRFAQQCAPEDHWLGAYLRDHEQAIMACAEHACNAHWNAATDEIMRLLLGRPRIPASSDRL